MHFAIVRVEPNYRGDHDRHTDAPDQYPVGYVWADCEFDATEIVDTMRFRIRGKELLILVELKTADQICRAKAVQRSRECCLADCIAVLERIHFSVD